MWDQKIERASLLDRQHRACKSRVFYTVRNSWRGKCSSLRRLGHRTGIRHVYLCANCCSSRNTFFMNFMENSAHVRWYLCIPVVTPKWKWMPIEGKKCMTKNHRHPFHEQSPAFFHTRHTFRSHISQPKTRTAAFVWGWNGSEFSTKEYFFYYEWYIVEFGWVVVGPKNEAVVWMPAGRHGMPAERADQHYADEAHRCLRAQPRRNQRQRIGTVYGDRAARARSRLPLSHPYLVSHKFSISPKFIHYKSSFSVATKAHVGCCSLVIFRGGRWMRIRCIAFETRKHLAPLVSSPWCIDLQVSFDCNTRYGKFPRNWNFQSKL